MRTKNIFKTVALAMMMPAMLLTSACSNQDDVVNNTAENTVTSKGYALPVTVNVTRQGDGTRATFDGSKLNFNDGDKLFVYGKYATGSKSFAGALDYVSEGTFSGTIYAQDNTYSTYDALFSAASAEANLTATLLPNGYDANGNNSFLSINNNSTTDIAYDDRLTVSYSKAFVASETAKATGVEQLSYERATTYSSGFALSPGNAILNFTISGLAAGAQNVSLQIQDGIGYTVSGSVTPNASGVATFAVGAPVGANIKEGSNNLTVGSSNFTLPSSTTFAVGKIYNITRSAIPGALIGQFSVSGTKKVYFSKGNLQATTANLGSTWTWAFAANQWDYIGGRSNGGSEPQTGNNFINGNGTVSANGTVDLFGWSTSVTTYGMNNSTNSSTYSGNFVDWGATMGTGWFTLSSDEWTYLFNNRSASTVGGTDNGRYAKGWVNSVRGVILFPDTYTHPNGVTAPTGVNATDNTGFYGNDYSSADWAKMESAGCVFLPAAGDRNGWWANNAGSAGCYWSSSPDGGYYALSVYFSSSSLTLAYSRARYWGYSVRLVHAVE